MIEVENEISVNDILRMDTLTDDKVNQISIYFNDLKKAGLIDLIRNGHYYDKNKYDFYFIIGDASKNWYMKLILKSTILDLVLKYKIINFVVHEYYEHN
jgi:hypothetical protein